MCAFYMFLSHFGGFLLHTASAPLHKKVVYLNARINQRQRFCKHTLIRIRARPMDFHLLTGLFVSFFCPELGLKLPQSTAFDHVCDINEIRQILNRVVEGNFGLSKGSYFQS